MRVRVCSRLQAAFALATSADDYVVISSSSRSVTRLDPDGVPRTMRTSDSWVRTNNPEVRRRLRESQSERAAWREDERRRLRGWWERDDMES